MTESKLHELFDLIEEIDKIEKLIVLHEQNYGENIMLAQYQAKKLRLTSELISSLNSPKEKPIKHIQVIKRVLEKYYEHSNEVLKSEDSENLDRLIEVL